MNEDSKKQVSEEDKMRVENLWDQVKDELDWEKEIPYPHLKPLVMCISGLREITIENPYRNPRSAMSIRDHEENLIADKLKALLKQEYSEDSEWEIKWEFSRSRS